MVGQGSPPKHQAASCCANRAARHLLLAALLLLGLAGPLAAEEVDLRLRASWGGGGAVAWSGSIELSAGKLGIDKVLGLEADAPGSVVQTEETQINLVARTPRRYDGLDLFVTAPRDALLRFEFQAGAGNQPSLKFEVPVEQLLQGRFAAELDKSGNRFAVHRSPGDMLRFEMERDHLVFRGGERFQATIVPHLVPATAGSTLKCALRLVPVGSENAVWQADHEVTLADDCSAAPLPIDTPLPQAEGVYELVAELQGKRFGTSLIRAKPVAERRVQLVVLAQNAKEHEAVEWSAIGEFDPAHPRLWDRMLRLPSMKMLAGFNKGPLGNEPNGTRNHLGNVWSTMKAAGWQAYPLPIGNVGEPHILEIEFPSDLPQSLAVSIVEPNAAGLVTPLGLDSGIDVDTPAPGRTAQVLTHRLVFWPRTNSPLVLLANRSDDAPAVFGKIRILSGPAALPTADVPAVRTEQGRMVAAYFDKPLFPENFSVAEALDARTGRTLDDWQVFHRGAVRFAEYLKYSGHNAAVVSVVCEGSALYPSEVLAPTPKYDTGAFSEAGADPLRKDVVEAMLRVFDREDLAFVPAIQFSSLLPELEQLKALGTSDETAGIDLIAADGRRWIESHPPRRGVAPYYNVLDPRVQQAMRRVVLEVAERYARHGSMRGVAIQISGDTYAQLPDDACGLDAVTLERFADDTGIAFPADEPTSTAARWQWIQRHAREKWLSWRAAEVAQFYRDMQEDLQAVRPELQLLLCPVEPLQSRRMQQRIHPLLPAQDQALDGLLHVGLAPEQLRQTPGLVFARPHYLESSLLQRLDAARSEINHSPQLDQATRGFATSAALSLAEPLPLRLEAFDRVSPFGYQNTHMFLMSHLSPVAAEARKRYVKSLAKNDSQWILDGGQMLPLGQEDATRSLLTTLGQLPAAPFVDVPPAAEDARTQPLVLRRWSDETNTWFYLLNDSSWPVKAEVEFTSPSRLLVETIGGKAKPTELPSAGGVASWKGTVEPFNVVALRIAKPDVKVAAWRAETADAVQLALREQIREIRLRANTLRSPPPVEQLTNDSFEQAPVVGRPVPRWSVAEGTGITVNVDQSTAKSGTSSLHLLSRSSNRGEAAPVVWVRSEPIPTPSTGRLALWVWLKVPDAKRQPKLRLAIEGRLDGQPYYRRANVGASEDGRTTQPLQESWSPFLFPVDDLPTTGLTDLQIGFDLMGEGEVWIDDVQIFDLWFQDVERDSLLKSIALADFQVQEGKVGDAFQFLESHWPQFLRHHVALSEPRVATVPTNSPPAGATTPKSSAAPPSGGSPGMMEGMRRWWPRMSSQK